MTLTINSRSDIFQRQTGGIRTDSASRILYSTDASIYQIEPLGVATPRSDEELIAVVEMAVKERLPLLPRGAGTSLAGQAVGRALIVDCSRWLDRIVEVNVEEGFAVVEPGVVLADLNRAAAVHQLMFGPDPASAERATMGGVIANNATGAHSILYGMAADHILSAEVILGDGSLETWGSDTPSKVNQTAEIIRERYATAIRENWTDTWRNSAGYRLNYLLPWSPMKPSGWEGEYPPVAGALNLAPLLAGSEGTLAVIRRAKVRLVPKPKQTILAVLSYDSVAEACDDVPNLLTRHPSAIELIPRMVIEAARSVPAYAREMGWVMGNPEALLVVEFSGDQPQALRDAAYSLNKLSSGNPMVVAQTDEEQARVWNVRKVGLGLMDSKPQSARPVAFIEDCAIPVERLGEFVREVEKILSAHETEGGMYAHASAGCLHIRPILDLKSSRGVTSLRAISEAVLALTLSLRGAMSSEHGDGLARSEHLPRALGAEVMDAMRLLKDAADPHHLLNPGKIIDPQKMDLNLRYGVTYQNEAWSPNLSFERAGGLVLAVEQCNGQGVCRKPSGVMCPSFQATRDEMHSTRGRANLLRALISSPSKYQVLEVESAAFQALDLCLACKGCVAECPSGVDMAKLKYEFENEFYKSNRRPIRDYLFGYFHIVAKFLSSIAPLANWLMDFPISKRLISDTLGLALKRPLPRLAGWRAKVSADISDVHRKRIIYLPDVFSRYIEPEVEQAALDVLTACEYNASVLPVVGAGASLLSKGFVDAARRHAGETLDALNQLDPWCEAVIVGVEPPEIYLLKNDYVDLLPERAEEIQRRLPNVWLLDEFLVRSDEFNALRVARLPSPENSLDKSPTVHFHPHCHQRAEGASSDGIASGAQASVDLLQSCGYTVELSNAGCCGMAGSFGFESDHYDLSMKVGELRYLPQTRELKIGEFASSTGAACRMQARHGAGRESQHPIELVVKRLSKDES